ncbi:MAG: choice-of-anchor J domain-containing protein, partial [Muribaculaceae bacterium]|nr:choice-of-anchor J domain-containing protein [Muribaculaceae bacterium]
MKKFLLFAVMASAIFAGSAMLPVRTVGHSHQMKSLGSETERVQQRHAVRRAAQGDSETAIAVPFTHTLGRGTEVADYLIVDANGDGRTWKPGGFTDYSVCMAPNTADVTAADDWMISPAVHLEAGQYYTVSFEEDMSLNKTEDKLGLYAGTERSAEGMTLTVIEEHAIAYNNKVFTKREAQFSVAETGNYYFGFHCTSEKDKSGTPKVCNFSIQLCENPIVAPEKFVEVPFTHTLGKNTEVAEYIVVDADEDTRTWKPGGFTGYSVCMKPTADNVTANNDWLISLPVHLLPGVNYTLSYEEGFTLSSGKEDLIGIYCGTEPEVEALT